MEEIKHECGIAMIRLLKPLEFYEKKYGTNQYALRKLYLMMEKQHNRGQEGAGVACVKLKQEPGHEYMFREKADGKDAITKVFNAISSQIRDQLCDNEREKDPFIGEMYMGHLRYSTTGKGGLKYVHPFLRRNNWRAKNLCLCGNFNMTNIDEVFAELTRQGQCPRVYSDTYTMLELMGHRLDREVERNFQIAKLHGFENTDITDYIEKNVLISNVLKQTMTHFDGGYVVCGLTGSGEMFSMRDPWGIRPAFYYHDEEIVAIASERPVLQTTFALECDDIKELLPGQAVIVKQNAEVFIKQILPAKEQAACSFERIYFSRGNDKDIYRERKMLGLQLRDSILKAIGNDTAHTVFSYIPNTAEVAYFGMVEGMKSVCQDVRTEKVVSKDIKLRTFISDSGERNDMAAHVYDITMGSLTPYEDNLVVIDDSIVRGTTLRESIIKILDRLHPKKIVLVSSAPQIRYPDYYGIDMARLEEFIAFRACIELLKDRGMHSLIDETYHNCKRELRKPKSDITCCVKALYKPFTVEELNKKMVEMLRPTDVTTPIEIVFQSIEGLHEAIPNHNGDWYFTGNYPTPGGMKLVNQAFVNYIENVYQYQQKF